MKFFSVFLLFVSNLLYSSSLTPLTLHKDFLTLDRIKYQTYCRCYVLLETQVPLVPETRSEIRNELMDIATIYRFRSSRLSKTAIYPELKDSERRNKHAQDLKDVYSKYKYYFDLNEKRYGNILGDMEDKNKNILLTDMKVCLHYGDLLEGMLDK